MACTQKKIKRHIHMKGKSDRSVENLDHVATPGHVVTCRSLYNEVARVMDEGNWRQLNRVLQKVIKMVVKVYGPVRAACPQRVLACLLEMGVEFEIIHVDLDAGDHKRLPFLARQPFGQVPVVEDGNFRLFESRAIIRYYAAKYGDRGPNLLGSSLEERAMVDQWLEVEAHNFNDLVYNLVLQLVILPRMGKPGDLAIAHTCEQKLETVLNVYEQRLSNSKYLAGDSFTLADLSHLPGIRYLMNEAGMGHLVRDRKNLNAWWEDISNRAAWKKLMELAA